jgi:hypothetical protein
LRIELKGISRAPVKSTEAWEGFRNPCFRG